MGAPLSKLKAQLKNVGCLNKNTYCINNNYVDIHTILHIGMHYMTSTLHIHYHGVHSYMVYTVLMIVLTTLTRLYAHHGDPHILMPLITVSESSKYVTPGALIMISLIS